MGQKNHLKVSFPEVLLELKSSLMTLIRSVDFELSIQFTTQGEPSSDLHLLLDPNSSEPLTHPEVVIVILSEWDEKLAQSWLAHGVMNCHHRDDISGIFRGLIQASRLSSLLKFGRLLPGIMNAIPAPIYYKDKEGRYLGFNDAFAEYLGIKREDLLGKTVFDVAPIELAQIYQEADLALLKSGGSQHYEAQVKYADGSLHNVDFHKAVFEFPPGEKAGQVGVMLDITAHKALEDQLKAQALSDPLTGAHNRRSFMSIASAALEQARRTGRPLSLLVMDLDHFKTINDRFSHATGDKVLIDVVNRCQECLRSYDILCRAGGEEFFVLLPDTDITQALAIATRIRLTISSISLGPPDSQFTVTTSIGVAHLSPADNDIDALIHRADLALYAAKNAGRNRVEIAQTQAIEPDDIAPRYKRRGENEASD